MLLACPAQAPSAASEPTNKDPAPAAHIKDAALSSDLSIRIVPSAVSEKGGRTITLFDKAQHFHVVLTNVSKKPMRLWREWCSWGYSNLSFAATDQGGKTTMVTKAPRGWDKNFPDFTIVSPGDHLVVDVTFEPTIWQAAPLPVPGKARTVSLRAVFEIKEDAQTKRNDVWTGKVSSPDETYTLFR